MIYNDNNSTSKVFYSGFTITKVYACGGELVWAASPYAFKAMYTLNDSTTGKVSCNSDSTLRYTDFGDQSSNVMYLTVGECVDNFETHLVSLMYSSLRTIDLTNSSITSLPSNFLNGVSTLREATLNPNTTTIGSDAFGGCTSLSDITIPSSVTSIELGAFSNSGLRDVTIYSGITYGNQVYRMCSSLSSVTIEEGTRSIPNGTFALSSGITEVTIPSSVTYVGSQAFIGCYGLSEVTCLPTTPPNLGESDVFPSSCIIYVPCSAMSAYTAHTDWQPYLDKLRPIEDNCETIIYRWQPSGTTCIDVDKYQNNIKQISYNSGATWSNVSPSEYSASTLIERNSTDCGYIEPQYRTISTAVTCSGVDKYKVDEHQESLDGGVTWTTTSTTIGDLIQANSYDCGYRTRTTSGTPYCVDVDKYQDVYSEYSTDSGTTWITASTTPTLIEADSEDCGYVPPTPIGFKFKITHSDDYISSAACDSTSAVTRSEILSTFVNQHTTHTARAIEIGDCVTEVASAACSSMENVTAVTIPNSVTTIGDKAFERLDSVSALTIPNSVISIGNSAFLNLKSISSVTIPDSVQTIGNAAFSQNGYTGVTVPCINHFEVGSGVTYIGNGAFSIDNENLTVDVIMHPTTPPTLVPNGNPFVTLGAAVYNIYLPNSAWDDYMADSLWSDMKHYPTKIHFFTIDPEYRTVSTATTCVGVDKYAVDEYQMTQNRWTTYQTISSTTGSLIEADSEDCGYVPPTPRNFKISANYIGGTNAVADCNTSTTLTFDEIKNLGEGYTAMTSAVVGDCTTTVDSYAFNGDDYRRCKNLSSITFSDSVTSIGRRAFTGNGLREVSCGSGLTSIGEYAFAGNYNLSALTIPNVTTIEEGAFQSCSGLTSLVLPDTLTTIGSNCFYNCKSLTNVHLSNNLTTIGSDSFYCNTSLTSINIPNSVATIGMGAFAGCHAMTALTIGSGITSIGDSAFNVCSGLTSITINATVPPTIGVFTFVKTNNAPIYVPSSAVETYKTATNWSDLADRIQPIL